jgi:hypothetical protein
MSDFERKRELIERAAKVWGFNIDGWDENEDGPYADLGRATVIEDDDDRGLFAGDAGSLILGVVGSPRFGNERPAFFFTPDGMDFGGDEVSPDELDLL